MDGVARASTGEATAQGDGERADGRQHLEGVAEMVAKLTPEARIISAHGQMVPKP